jgi:D-3-phosphoglycerate dehydrogenase
LTKSCLFSAPFDFLPESTHAAYQDLVPTEFREIWKRDQLGDVSNIKTWVPNPGQNFIIDTSVLDKFPALSVIATPSTGTNHINKDDCAARGVAVYSLLDNRPALDSISASPEFTFLLLLNTFRRLDVCMNEVSNDRWRQNEELMRGRELNGKTVGLVGMGRIGKRLKKWCEAFDAGVQYYDPYVDDVDGKVATLAEVFSTSDVVCVCCYLTDETTNMIGKAELDVMKPGACLVNTSRGEVIDEADLVSFIHARPDVEVAIDVLSGEVTGTQMSSPLIDLHKKGRIVVTPHIAGASGESQSKAALGALGCLQEYFGAS